MSTPDNDPNWRQRLLEGWMPLAQDANQRYGWDLHAAALERLIMTAAPALYRTRTVLEAYAILWSAYTRLRQDVTDVKT